MATKEKNPQRRAFERIPANLMVHFYYGDSINFGTVTNISENGMFVRTKMVMADIDSQFEIIIPSQHTEIKVPVKVKRISMDNTFYEGFGAELMDPSKEYAEYVKNLKSSES